MLNQNQQNDWSCLITSAANVTGIPVEQLTETIGHDGSGEVFEGEEYPENLRAYHVQEIVEALYQHGYGMLYFQVEPVLQCLTSEQKQFKLPNRLDRIMEMIMVTSGIIEGVVFDGRYHAIANQKGTLFDPCPTIKVDSFDNINILAYHLVFLI